jgi:DMSO/TMAO reductase YedYZ molybdopterin-dependent catalytic subunit
MMNGIKRINRRQILIQFGEASALITVAGAFVGAFPGANRPETILSVPGNARWSETHALPNVDAPVKPAPGTRPEFTPMESHFRMDLGSAPPAIREQSWRLRVTGLVSRPQEFSLSDIRKFEPVHHFITLACITNPVAGGLMGTTRWTGVSLERLLKEVNPRPGATHLKIESWDGFYECFALDKLRGDARVMLAYEWDGVPLPIANGFPMRIYIPDLYGMKLPKWIRSLELIDRAEKGYWVKRGWDAKARIHATSVIDTTNSTLTQSERNGQPAVQLGGIAFAGARGISKVQLQVDQEIWRDSQLRMPLSELTWVVWRFDWPFKAGRHNFTVRCFEKDGTPQITSEAPPNPSGATGLHRFQMML